MKVVLFANSAWYLYNFRLALAEAIRANGHEVVMLSPPGPFVEALEAEGYRCLLVEMDRREVHPGRQWKAVRQIAEHYRREAPDLVHHFTLKSVVCGSLAARRAGVRHVVNAIAGLGYVFTSRQRRARMLRPVLRAALGVALRRTEVIFQNPDDLDALRALKLVSPAQAHLILGSGVDTERFTPVTPPDGVPLVILASRMLRGKGIEEFAEAAAHLHESGVPGRFVLVGPTDPGNPSAVPEDQIRAWEAQGAVEWWGFRDDMEAVLAQSHIICLPSRYGEGVPRILIEGAAMGRPLVATDTPGCREIVREGENGFHVPISDARALAAALERLLTDAALREQMGAASRRIAEEGFSEMIVLDATLGVYECLRPGFRLAGPASGDGAEQAVVLTD